MAKTDEDWKAGAKRIVITENGRQSWSVRCETWDVMPGIAPEPFYDWDEVEGTYSVCHSIKEAFKEGKRLLKERVT